MDEFKTGILSALKKQPSQPSSSQAYSGVTAP